MSQFATGTAPSHTGPERQHLDKLCASIRGKLQFMDYLVRAAMADVDRYEGEHDAGTRIFLKQLIEMHATNLSVECENMRMLGELCGSLESVVSPPSAYSSSLTTLRNGDAA